MYGKRVVDLPPIWSTYVTGLTIHNWNSPRAFVTSWNPTMLVSHTQKPDVTCITCVGTFDKQRHALIILCSPGGPRSPGSPRSPLAPLRPAGPTGPLTPLGPCFPLNPGSPFVPLTPGIPGLPFFPRRPVMPCSPLSPFAPGIPLSPFLPGGPLGPWGPGCPGIPKIRWKHSFKKLVPSKRDSVKLWMKHARGC